tara:strand:- start:4895 stop:5530 length:636 start_codon:yes stop_codon:yes gene_type:complete
MFRFVILIPSFNEEKTLKKIINNINKNDIYVINDASTDNTKLLKFKKNVKIINNKKNIGYENSLFKGIKILKNKEYDYIITMDADGEHSTSSLKKIIDYCNKYSPDLVVGNRSRKNRVSESLLSYLFKIRFNIFDPLSGFKAYKIKSIREHIKNYEIKQSFLVDLLYLFIKKGSQISNIVIASNAKPIRKSRVGNSISANFKIISCLIYLI